MGSSGPSSMETIVSVLFILYLIHQVIQHGLLCRPYFKWAVLRALDTSLVHRKKI